MDENELFQAALGLLPPWTVERCSFDETAGRLDIYLDFPRGSVFSCPVCQAANCKAYDTDSLTWRHLNFFQHQAFLPHTCAQPSRRVLALRYPPRGRSVGQTGQRLHFAV